MSDALNFSEIDGQHIELLPERTVMSVFRTAGKTGTTGTTGTTSTPTTGGAGTTNPTGGGNILDTLKNLTLADALKAIFGK